MNESKQWFQRGKKVMPGGVNSPVRGFGSVGLEPRFIQKGQGAYLTDEDGKEYLDFVGSWGPMITGHCQPKVMEAITETLQNGLSFGAATKQEVELAELITEAIPSVEMIRMVNSGTEAVMSALRLARAYTKRDKIIKFEGCYHGHSDSMLVKAGSGAMTFGNPDSEGVTQGVAKDTLTATYNDISTVASLFEHNKDEVACVILEPVAANMGVILPQGDFLQEVKALCKKEGALLIFDEVITGFRLGFGGAQAYFNVEADLVTYGKIIGGGLPVGAYGGKREIMEKVAPLGGVYQAGTLSGNPLAMAAGLAELRYLKENPQCYQELETLGQWFAEELEKIWGNQCQMHHIGSLLCCFFTSQKVVDYHSAKTADTEKYARYFRFMLEKGVYFAPSQFEAMFLSTSHTKAELERVVSYGKEFASLE